MDQHHPSVEVPQGLDAHVYAALQEMRFVVDDLRKQGCHHQANQIGQLSLALINTFYDALAQIRSDHASQSPQQQQVILGMNPLPSPIPGQGLGVMNDQPAAMSVEQGHPEPAGNDPRQQAPQHLPVPIALPVPGASWAQIASASSSSERSLPRPSSVLSRVQAPERPLSHANRGVRNHAGSSMTLRTGGRRNTVEAAEMRPSGAARRHVDSNAHGILEDGKAGVVVIKGPFDSIQDIFSYISSRIHEGAIYDMSMNKDQEAVVVFQYALHAQIFVDRNTESVATRHESLFGSGDWNVTLGEPMEWTDTLRRMAHPHRERRRLTFVKSRLFADNASFQKWVREVQDVAGPANVDFVWAFNTGNATAVFFNVATARKVMQTFLNWRSNRGCYEDLIVSYSSDPCEKDLQLTTQLRYHAQPSHRTFQKVGPNGLNAEHGGHHHYHSSRK